MMEQETKSTKRKEEKKEKKKKKSKKPKEDKGKTQPNTATPSIKKTLPPVPTPAATTAVAQAGEAIPQEAEARFVKRENFYNSMRDLKEMLFGAISQIQGKEGRQRSHRNPPSQ